MELYGNIFFVLKSNAVEATNSSMIYNSDTDNSYKNYKFTVFGYDNRYQSFVDRNMWQSLHYDALPEPVVTENLRVRADLQEFKRRFQQHLTSPWTFFNEYTGRLALPSFSDMLESKNRTAEMLYEYADGLKHLVIKSHPWVMKGWARRECDLNLATQGTKFLEFLSLAPTVRNAKKVLESMGVWHSYTNIEKFVMDIRVSFANIGSFLSTAFIVLIVGPVPK
jgi:hypothetical protein